MNVINEVLNQLEKRGANAPLDEAAVRPVPPRSEPHPARYALLAVPLLALAAGAKWYLAANETPSAMPPAAVPVAVAEKREPAASAVASATAQTATAAPVAVKASEVAAAEPVIEAVGKTPAALPSQAKHARSRPHRAPEQLAKAAEPGLPEDTGHPPLKTISPQQRADNEYSKANLAAREGRIDDALAGYEAALLIDASHKEARRAWAGLLISLKRNDDAERVLENGLRRDPHDASFAMLLARLQVERNAVPLALETLQKTLPDAAEQPDYQAFVAALLQRLDRHDEAIAHYQAALRLAPNNGVWLMGIGISLQATKHNADAREAYRRALASGSLSPQLQAFVQGKLKEL